MFFSLIIPVYNRPEEVRELLESLSRSDYSERFEVVIVEDGSSAPCLVVLERFPDLEISYYMKPNTGPGDSRNYGMNKAKGDYYLIFDSDCIVPPHYLRVVSQSLQDSYADCFGGPDKAMKSFSNIQKAINFGMTSFLTTGGIRGGSERLDRFQPRSFNMGISKSAFEASGGFADIHPGEDPDLSIRLWKLGFKTRLIPEAYVYHKRRISWKRFYIQVNKFGKARPILDTWHPRFAKATYFLPSAFLLGFIVAILSVFFGFSFFIWLYAFYFVVAFVLSAIANRSIQVGALSVMAVAIQFYGYGTGFLQSYFQIQMLGKKPQEAFPELFFKV
ncbi:MAG TPA: glycosyltransferase [Flavobacterium sp.]|jgi:glycosyltransferase involved in cell wall biosynthesis